MKKTKYPSEDEVIEFNILALSLIKVKKADKAEVLSYKKIQKVINDCKKKKKDLYNKAVILLKGLVQSHAFASGNRRTAFITTKYFIKINNGKFNIRNNPSYARVMIGIREDYYSDNEIKNWIRNGKIKAFKR